MENKKTLRTVSLVVTICLTALLAMLFGLNLLCGFGNAIILGMMHAPAERIPLAHPQYGIQPAFVIDFVAIVFAWGAFGCRWYVTAMVIAFLPIVNETAIWYSQMAVLSTPERRMYEKVNGAWYLADYNLQGRLAHKLDADDATFQIVTTGKYHCYGKDKNCAYWYELPIPGSDPETFEFLAGAYSRDKAKVYCGTLAMHVPDPAKFEVVEPGYSRGWTSKEFFLEQYGDEFTDVDLDKGIPEVGSGWGRDGTSYYFGPTRVIGADYDTFQIIDSPLHDNAKDKNGRFSGWKRE